MTIEDRKRHILIVDDTAVNIKILRAVLHDEGYKVTSANSGDEALEKAVSSIPDLILLDVMMPGINGFETCEKLKKNQVTTDIPVIFITALMDTEEIVKGFNVGAVDYVKKPFNSVELLARVNTHLELKYTRDELKASLSQEKHMAIVGQMASGQAHDFNNILSVVGSGYFFISKYTKKIMDGLLENNMSSVKENIDKIETNCARGKIACDLGGSIVQGLLTFVQGASGSKIKQLLLPLLEANILMEARRIKLLELEIERNIENEAIDALCNAGEIQQVILNLFKNAMDAMELSKTKKLTLRLWSDSTWANFSIQDTGQGISDKNKSKIFDQFYTSKPKGKGTGIGLGVVKKIIDSHGGKIKFDSDVDVGTIFTVSLPIELQVY